MDALQDGVTADVRTRNRKKWSDFLSRHAADSVRTGHRNQISEPDPILLNALGLNNPIITPHPDYLRLGTTTQSRRDADQTLLAEELPPSELDAVRAHTRQQRVYANNLFRQQIEALTQRCVNVRPRGRPRRQSLDDGKSSCPISQSDK